jgi:hypothetical protein
MSSILSASTSATAPRCCCSVTLSGRTCCARVSDYTARQFLAGAESIALRYPGLPPAAFAQPAPETLAEYRSRTGLRADSVLISDDRPPLAALTSVSRLNRRRPVSRRR